MRGVGTEIASWNDGFRAYMHPKAIAMLFLGLSAGIPILLIFSTLSVWLREAGVERSAVTFFSWAALGYSFKFLWAPIIDMLPLPFLTRFFGRRRAWLLVTQCCIIVAIVWMAYIDPAQNTNNLTLMALAAVLLGFSSASQDVVIDAYRIESAEESLQALLSSMYIAGYRVGMLVAGAGSLFLADFIGGSHVYSYYSWQWTYLAMAAMMLLGVVTTLCIAEPEVSIISENSTYSPVDYLRFLVVFVSVMLIFAVTFFKTGAWLHYLSNFFPFFFTEEGKISTFLVEGVRFSLSGFAGILVAWCIVATGFLNKRMARQAYYAPIRDFFVRYNGKTACLILLLIGLYRLSDIVLGVVSNVFYLDMGYSKTVIAGITKSFGLGMTLAGGFLGGVLTVRFGIQRILFLGAFLSAATNLLFMLLSSAGNNLTLLTVVIGADNLSAGIATTAFVAFLSSLTNVSFTAVQYAIFSSMMTLLPKLVGGYSGTMVSAFGYEKFFMLTAVMGIPVLFLIIMQQRIKDQK